MTTTKPLEHFPWNLVINPHMPDCLPIVIVEPDLHTCNRISTGMTCGCLKRHIAVLFVPNELEATSANIELIRVTGRGFELQLNRTEPWCDGSVEEMLYGLFD